MRVGAPLATALAGLTRFRPGGTDHVGAGALALYPLVGFGLGAVAALTATAVELGSPWAAGPAGVLALAWLAGPRGPAGLARLPALSARGAPAAVRARFAEEPGAAGRLLAMGALAGRVMAAAALPVAARTTALLVAPMLGAWAVVVQCHGGAPADARDPADALVGRADFGAFGWASLTAFALTLALGDALGLVCVVAAALTTLGVRVLAHRRAGGLTGSLLAATRELVETVVLGLLGLLSLA